MTMARSLTAAAVLLALACGACGEGDDRTGDAGGENAQPPASTTLETCLPSQSKHVRQVRRELQHLTGQVLAAPDRTHPTLGRRLEQLLDGVAETVAASCAGSLADLEALVTLVDSRADDSVDEPYLQDLIDTFRTWANAVGSPKQAMISYRADPCVAVRDQVGASWRAVERPHPDGSIVTFEVAFTNDTSHDELYIEHGGLVDATSTAPDGKARRYGWGGSSADTVGARSGQSSTAPAALTVVDERGGGGPLPPPFGIVLLPGGQFKVSELYATALGRGVWCTVPMRQTF